jgi:hypothetical protein
MTCVTVECDGRYNRGLITFLLILFGLRNEAMQTEA